MTLAEKVNSVEEVFQTLDTDISTFQTHSGLQCKSGCGQCCHKADIEATVLEFLPLAYYMYKQGSAMELYENVSSKSDRLCVMLGPSRAYGMCLNYRFRGMICRIFGFTGRMNKHGRTEMITCKIIKTEHEESYNSIMNSAANGISEIPLAQQYYRRLMSVDDELSRTTYPINIAIKKAIEEVMHYYAYREIGEE